VSVHTTVQTISVSHCGDGLGGIFACSLYDVPHRALAAEDVIDVRRASRQSNNPVVAIVVVSPATGRGRALGVTSVGRQLKLLEAIAALRNDTSKVPSVGAATTSGAPYRTIDPSLLSRCYLCRRWTRLNTEIPRAVELEELVEPIRRRYRVGPASSCHRRGI
jgi:hypothetical protein